MPLNEKHQLIPPEDLKSYGAVSALDEIIDWGLLISDIPSVWTETKGENIKIAVLDTGVFNHIDFGDALIERYDTTGEGIDPPASHATHVTGAIAARKNNMGIIGVAPECKIYSIKVLNAHGVGTIKNIIQGLELCRDLDCQIINMSLGLVEKPPDNLHNIIKKLYSQGKFIIAAAGNNSGAVNYPAIYQEVIAVAPIDKNNKLASFASRGPQVAAVAPGVDVYSTILNNEYGKMSGSSQAAPFFSGVCALLLSYAQKHPDQLVIKSLNDMLRTLDELCDPDGSTHYSGKLSDVGFGVPHFAKNMPWRSHV
jgi:subtilisin family serine protease